MNDYKGPSDVNHYAKIAAVDLNQRITDLLGSGPRIMIVLGSGCGDVANKIEKKAEIDYSRIPGMPVSTVPGHKGALMIGMYNGKPVLAFQGRKHYYEGASPHEASFMMYLAKQLGVKVAIMTTATGIVPNLGTKPGDIDRYPAKAGDLVVVYSYDRNFLQSSLRGPITEDIGARFNGTINAPSIYLTMLAREVAGMQGWLLQKGVYVPQEGPDYETPAEIVRLSQFSHALGLPVLAGMSVTPELQAANMLNLDSLVIAVVTNQCFDLAAKEKIELELDEMLDGVLSADGTARHTLTKANELLWPIVKKNQPSHQEVTENAGKKDVTERLEGLIGGVVKAIKF